MYLCTRWERIVVSVSFPTFSPAAAPAQLVHTAGDWLADHMEPGTRYLRSKRDVVRQEGDRSVGLTLQTSTWSRAGVGTWVQPRIWARDQRVRVWELQRMAHGPRWDPQGLIFSTLVLNLGAPISVELHGPLRSAQPSTTASFPEFWEQYQRDFAPRMQLFWGTPAQAVAVLPARWIEVSCESLFYWAAAYEDVPTMRLLIEHYRTHSPGSGKNFVEGVRLGLTGDPEPQTNNVAMRFGWRVATSRALKAEDLA